MPIRLSGMQSGLDTDSIITELVKAKSAKVTTLQGDQKKLEWKQDAWKGLNSKIYGFYSKTLSNTRLKSDLLKKTTKASSDAVSVTTGGNAPDCVQSLKINSMAKAGYLTGAQFSKTDGAKASSSTKMGELMNLADGETKKISISAGGKNAEIEITKDTTIKDVMSGLQKAGVNANFDANNQRCYISASGLGTANDFTLSGDSEVLSALGINESAGQGKRINGEDASIELNGVTYTSSKNNFDINGLNITINKQTSDEITLTTSQDTDGIYDQVKNLLKEYNSLINEMDKLYNAESASKYKMLSEEEREAMGEDDAKEWDEKIKSSLLRRDSTLSGVINAMKQTMLGGIKMSDGTTKYLSDFGINTLGYFSSGDNEKGAYHIDGDEDDDATREKEDKLRAAIASDADGVASFFADLSKNLYSKLDGLMSRTEYSSAFTVYNDKQMKTEYNDYKTKIAAAQEKVNYWEDFYYSKFGKMESALAGLQSKSAAFGGLFGAS